MTGGFVMLRRMTVGARIKQAQGDLVVVERRRHGTTEATAKRLVRDGARRALRAESTDPQYLGIIPLGPIDAETEIVITAIVLGKYSAIKRGPA